MSKQFDRREFIKIAGLAGAGLPLGKIERLNRGALQSVPTRRANEKNILVLVFDTWSALNVGLYGYPRETMPNLRQIAEKATVYHNHFAGNHETYAGTTTLLTGANSWTTWGFEANKFVRGAYKDVNLFGLFEDYYRMAYTHNLVAETVLDQFAAHIDHYQPRQSLYFNSDYWLNDLFGADFDIAGLSWVRGMQTKDDGYANSLFLGRVYELNQNRVLESFKDQFPLGPPVILEDNYFLLEDGIDWLSAQMGTMPNPYLAYVHFMPPHAEYRPRTDFFERFKDDGYQPMEKEIHPMANLLNQPHMLESQRLYDEYMLYVDAEFNRFYQTLEANGQLDNTILVLTSDHGESFERGIYRHGQATFHQPVINVPLMVFEPGQSQRRDVYEPTIALDVLPTLLHLTGREIPSVLEGRVLPPYMPLEERPIYAASWRPDKSNQIREKTTVMMVRGQYKVMVYEGYRDVPEDFAEVYDLENDPEEVENLAAKMSDLIQEVKEKMTEASGQQSE